MHRSVADNHARSAHLFLMISRSGGEYPVMSWQLESFSISPLPRFAVAACLFAGACGQREGATADQGPTSGATSTVGGGSSGEDRSTATTTSPSSTAPFTSSAEDSDSAVGSSTGAPACARPAVAGRITNADGDPLEGARVTLATADLSVVHETRTDIAGTYVVEASDGSYQLGASVRGLAYAEEDIEISVHSFPTTTLFRSTLVR